MTVRKLIERLQTVDQDLPVSMITTLKLNPKVMYNFRAIDLFALDELYIQNFPYACYKCNETDADKCKDCETVKELNKELEDESKFYNTRNSAESK